MSKVYKLAIESGIGGGTVSIIKGGRILDYRICRHPAHKADQLLEEISELLKTNKVEKTNITEIIYSEQPGSHTGLKIGASIAKGLHLAFNAGVRAENLFDCIIKHYLRNGAALWLIVLPADRSNFVWRIYDAEGSVVDAGRLGLELDEINGKENRDLDKTGGLKIILPLPLVDNPDRIYQKFGLRDQNETVDLGENLSGYLALE